MFVKIHIAQMLRFGLRSVHSKLEALWMLLPCFIDRIFLMCVCTVWRKEKQVIPGGERLRSLFLNVFFC